MHVLEETSSTSSCTSQNSFSLLYPESPLTGRTASFSVFATFRKLYSCSKFVGNENMNLHLLNPAVQ
uniref:Uncharacterized protein n=1 Tax=Arundo donax TaxID=35708 RepID=A0A0A9SXM2_ARUDO